MERQFELRAETLNSRGKVGEDALEENAVMNFKNQSKNNRCIYPCGAYAGGRIRTPEGTKPPGPQPGRIDHYRTPAEYF